MLTEMEKVEAAAGAPIILTNWEGSIAQAVSSNNTTIHQITDCIPAGKIVVVSIISAVSTGNVADAAVELKGADGAAIAQYSGQYADSKMSFFKITAAGNYTLNITARGALYYYLRVAVVNAFY
ncbi:hypothetical protein KL86CLO1_12515 [uncultured Eubacteriales bacterium]|uniref:Uncharacterized protein n=1 Tax=uncultured Eubacteriales bacterium TaxID=172733 RepID=A0A212KAK0_9FIRM|nr:hypothetical protein KL86CLO1_12515 [uncultured Eubacteriales bacterium]